MLNKKYESITGRELPQKTSTNKKIYKINTFNGMINVLKNSIFVGYGWGRAVNNGCELRKLSNNVEIEVYRCCGQLMSVFIIK